MIKPLRKFHFIFWRIWAVLLPFVFIAAILFRPPAGTYARNIKAQFSADLDHVNDTTSLLRISIRGHLSIPSCLVFRHFHGEKILIGRLNHPGAYAFEIPREDGQALVELYDPIHQARIAMLTLEHKN